MENHNRRAVEKFAVVPGFRLDDDLRNEGEAGETVVEARGGTAVVLREAEVEGGAVGAGEVGVVDGEAGERVVGVAFAREARQDETGLEGVDGLGGVVGEGVEVDGVDNVVGDAGVSRMIGVEKKLVGVGVVERVEGGVEEVFEGRVGKVVAVVFIFGKVAENADDGVL